MAVKSKAMPVKNKAKPVEEKTVSAERIAIAGFLLQYRSSHNLSQFEFGCDCGISKDTVSLLERKRCNPRLDTLQNIAIHTGTTVAKILTFGMEDSSD